MRVHHSYNFYYFSKQIIYSLFHKKVLITLPKFFLTTQNRKIFDSESPIYTDLALEYNKKILKDIFEQLKKQQFLQNALQLNAINQSFIEVLFEMK